MNPDQKKIAALGAVCLVVFWVTTLVYGNWLVIVVLLGSVATISGYAQHLKTQQRNRRNQ